MTVVWCDTCRRVDHKPDPQTLMVLGWAIIDERWRCPDCRRPIANCPHTACWGGYHR